LLVESSAPVISGKQLVLVSPNIESGGLQSLLEIIDVLFVLVDVGQEDMLAHGPNRIGGVRQSAVRLTAFLVSRSSRKGQS
jgi:hypothetical protein